MKRLGAIIAIALVLTIGGVYAAFNYAQGGVVSVENEMISKELAGMTTDTPKGTITIKSNNFKITVDDLGGDLHTKGKFEGKTTINFTPAPLADADVRANGIKLKLTINVNGSNEYKDGETTYKLFNISADALAGVTLNNDAAINGDFVIDFAKDIAKYITVTDIYLSTPEKYTAYSNAFKATTITFTISETV